MGGDSTSRYSGNGCSNHGDAATIDATRYSRRHAPQSLARCSLHLDASLDAAEPVTPVWDDHQLRRTGLR